MPNTQPLPWIKKSGDNPLRVFEIAHNDKVWTLSSAATHGGNTPSGWSLTNTDGFNVTINKGEITPTEKAKQIAGEYVIGKRRGRSGWSRS